MSPYPLLPVRPAAPIRPVKEYELKGMYVYGCDTETYSIGGRGLRSIQLAGNEYHDEWLLTPPSYEGTDEEVTEACVNRFLEFLHDPCKITKDTLFAFFNLRFDWSWMYRAFLRRPDDPPDTLRFEYRQSRGRLKDGQIRVFEGPNQVYKIEIRVNGHNVYFLDIHNFLTTMTLKEACEAYEVQSKMDIDHMDFAKCEPEGIEREYSMQDARSTRDLYLRLEELGIMSEANVTTIASSSLHDYQLYLKKTKGMSYNEFHYGTDDPVEIKRMVDRNELELRSSLRGGWVECFQEVYDVVATHIDARSMHPSQCVADKIPFGTFSDEPPEGPIDYTYIIKPVGYFKLKENGIKYVQWRNKPQCIRYSIGEPAKPSEYVEEFILDGSYAFWEDEWNTCVLPNYDYEPMGEPRISYIRMCENDGPKGWITEHYEDKKNAPNEPQRNRAKIFVNSFYGKQVTNPVGESVRYIYDEQAGHWSREKYTDKDRPVNHLPFGSWIVMRSRVVLMQVCRNVVDKCGIDKLYYIDTDSVMYGGEPEDAGVVFGRELTQWGIEHGGKVRLITLGPKTYQELTESGKVITKCAGLNRSVSKHIPYGELKDGNKYEVIKACRHPTIDGIIFEKTTFVVKKDRMEWSYRL